MNVFDDQSSGITTLSAPKGARSAATVAIILEQLKIKYHIDLIAGAKNSNNEPTLPAVLIDIPREGEEHVCLHGLDEIATYLLRQYDSNHALRYPEGSAEEEKMHEWMKFLADSGSQSHQVPPFARLAVRLFLRMERQLSRTGSRFLVGGKCTLVDLAYFPYVAAADATGLDVERFAELTAWYNRLIQMPAVLRGMAAVQLEVPDA